MRRRRGPSTAPILAVFALMGAILGLALSVLAGGRLQTPGTLQPQHWRTISPALDETVTNPLLGRGSQLVDGALVIREHAFHASDVLVPQLQGIPARVELEVEAASGPVTLVLSTGPQAPRVMLTLTADRFSLDGVRAESWQERGTLGPWVVRSDPAGTVLVTGSGDALLVAHGLTGVELTTNGEEARVGSIVVYDADEQVIFVDDFEGDGASPWVAVAGALLGALWGLAFAGAVLGGGGIVLPLVLAGAAFGSYGWGGGAIGQMEAAFEAMKIERVAPSIKVKYVPADEDLAGCFELGAKVSKRLREVCEG